MFRHRSLRHDLLAAALLAAFAAAAGATASDETSITVRTAAGAIERVDFAGELAPGERRALSTRLGNPATLTRTEQGLLLELADERYELPNPSPDLAGLATDADGHGTIDGKPVRKIVIRRDKDVSETVDAEGAERKSNVVVKIARHGEGAAGADAIELDPELLVLDPADPELALAAAEGKGQRVIVTRRIKREAGSRID